MPGHVDIDGDGGRVETEMKILLTAADEDLIRAVLVPQLGRIALPGLELDSDLLLVQEVGALEDDAKGALAYLLPDAVVHAHDVGRRGPGSHCGWSFAMRLRGGGWKGTVTTAS